MSRRAALLFPAALGVSAAAHLLALFLLPYNPAQPARRQPEPIPVRLLEAAKNPSRPPAASRQATVRPEPVPVLAEPAQASPPEPEQPQAQQPESASPESPLELAPPESAVDNEPPMETSATEPRAGTGAEPNALAAEIAAIQAVLSSLRGRIIEKIRYPPLARANGWKGTVLLEVLLDGEGRLQGLEVRRSSGYTMLDRAAAVLVRSVTPVPNPLRRPLRIEIPIAYELKE